MYRVILGELARITDHLTCNGAMAMELGAFTPFLWMHQGARDGLGHPRGGDRRAHDAQLRPHRRHGEAAHAGRSRQDMPRRSCPRSIACWSGVRERCSCKQPHLPRPPRGRRQASAQADALALGVTGPCCARPASPTTCARRTRTSSTTTSTSTCRSGTTATTSIASWCAWRRCASACRIIAQALERLADDGPINVDDPRVILPAEGRRLHHDRRHHPALQAGDGGREARRRARSTATPKAATASSASTSSPTAAARRTACACRPPCFASTCKAAQTMISGTMIADIVPTFGSVNMIGGECDH